MFYALLEGCIDTRGYDFVHERADTESLNLRADRGDVDVLAVSIARYPSIAASYQLFGHGMSVGRGYGPVLVSHTPRTLSSLVGAVLGVPGLRTTAYLTLRLFLPTFEPRVLPIAPFSRTFEALSQGEVEAALLIHEGRLTFQERGLHLVEDLGTRWMRETGLPLALGGNAIRRALGTEVVREVSALCRESIAWAIAHRDEVMQAMLRAESRSDLAMTAPLLDQYLSLYANRDTEMLADDTRAGIAELYRRAVSAGLLAEIPPLDFA